MLTVSRPGRAGMPVSPGLRTEPGGTLRDCNLQSRVDRLALQREHAEDAFVDPIERLAR